MRLSDIIDNKEHEKMCVYLTVICSLSEFHVMVPQLINLSVTFSGFVCSNNLSSSFINTVFEVCE